RERGALGPGDHDLLNALAERHLRRHGRAAGLAALPAAAWLLEALGQTATGEPARADAAAPRTEQPPAAAPERAAPPRYRPPRAPARGGLGDVFVALDCELRREVALKEIQPPQADIASARALFLHEAAITGQLEHPGIVPVYGLGRHADGRPYY